MASSKKQITKQRRNSTASTNTLWDKLPEVNSVSVDIANDNDFLDENDLTENDIEDELEAENHVTNSRKPLHKGFASSSNLENIQQNTPLWALKEYDQVKLIVDKTHAEDVKTELQRRLSKKGIRWMTNDDERTRSWYFGLSFVLLQLERAHPMDIMRLTSIRSFPFWLRFKNKIQQQRRIKSNSEYIKPIRYGYSPPYRVSLRYGALTKINEFRYSIEHAWSNQPKTRWSLFVKNDYYGGCIEWVMEEPKERKKKQLLAINVDRTIIMHLLPDGFVMYICQTCNMNEFSAKEKLINVARRQNPSHSFPRRPGPIRPSFGDGRLPRRPSYEKDKRSSIRNGIYFPTVQFELRIDSDHLTNEKAQNTVRQTYTLLTKFFSSHNITICHGTIDSHPGPQINSFPILKLPTLIMKYSWEMLVNIGYRLLVQIDQKFRDDLDQLSKEERNADDLFYRVCVYLSRLFTLEPFVNLSEKLHDAVIESKRKRADATFGLINSLDLKENTETYVPSVTLTPTTIRIKPFKLCRTNRVLRAEQEFGKALEHFALVEIRDENGQPLQGFHFRDLHHLFLDYLENGFTLMGSNRYYRYLHHSQSQLRVSQFWFYHHESGLNRSFDEAYKWMGTFDKERNAAKYASRVALCFSTTTPTINIEKKNVQYIDDIKTKDGKLTFTDGCGTMSKQLRDDIQKQLGKRSFSAVQFRYAGAKGVVSVDKRLGSGHHLCIRPSMNKFESKHCCFEVCKISAPRPLYLNRQAILLLSHRRISDAAFLILQQRNHLTLIQALLRNNDARNLLEEKLPYWFLPDGAKIDFVREPFFRQLLIAACLISIRELLRRTRIRVSPNKARNMFGIIDEYNVLKPDEVFIQYTRRNDHEDKDDSDKRQKTRILSNCKVVVTKNPCHHPGDIRTFTAVNREELKHLKDVIVFSQQGDRPASHQISGSDLDGDEYAVIWHEDLVPLQTPNAIPFDYDSQKASPELNRPVERNDINDVILKIAESDYLGRLSNLHLAYADRYGVDSNERPNKDVLSTIELAGAISLEVDSGKTGQHPLDDNQILQQKNALGDERPDFMENTNMKSYQSKKVLGKLYRSSRRTLPGWNRLLRRHRHLRHLQVRTPEDDEINDEEEQEVNADDIQKNIITLDSSLLKTTSSRQDQELSAIASQLFYVYRQEMLEILNLYGLSHESDLWCRKSTNTTGGELEDTAYTQLEQLVARTRDAFFLRLVSFCPDPGNTCNGNTAFEDLGPGCQKMHNAVAAALYRECYSGQNESERAPILSLPWLFTTALLQTRQRELPSKQGSLSMAMEAALSDLIHNRLLQLEGLTLTFCTSNNRRVKTNVHWTVCVFVEILHYCIEPKSFVSWPKILSRFICKRCSGQQTNPMDEWSLVFDAIEQDDIYAVTLRSLEWTEDDDELMHSYFVELLEICFDLGQTMADDNNEYLRMSEEIILILQRVALDETLLPENWR
ncbi:unnamed protein product [Rotaria sp. Silwood1]|nr:unnamed protein product [Rotaria sp. Silwood1]CAF3670305.1 unnamed protein product [Rotaria sp. Silwood1]CAF3676345.1 unnamed protein product [Rotaria sp. Silwood1]CAF3687125.1 unnamed protein product [Rotaria sp. Silwood1]CAF4607576.1 unnamed protein product [Rotaria sp. Silwood1]